MSKDKVLEEFETDFTDPGSHYSGEYLYEHIVRRAKYLIKEDREGVIEACRYWFSLRKEPHTMLAVYITKDLIIKELKPDLEKLKHDIESGKVFLLYYKRWVDEALAAIG